MDKMKKILAIPLVLSMILPSSFVKANSDTSYGNGQKYEKTKASKIISEYSIYETEEYIKPEVLEKLEVLDNTTVLEPLTDYNYEVALAYEDGSYEFVKGTNDIQEAKELTEKIGLTKKGNEPTVGAVINQDGNVVYSPNGVGIIRKCVDGSLDTSGKKTTDIYSSSDLRSAYTYVNHTTTEDVALINRVGSSGQIQVAGTTGWVKMPDESGNYDLVVLPITQYTNPSHYYTKDGALYHFISKEASANYLNGNTVNLGPAPKELVEGKKYLSFDGIYFYEITTNGQAYTNLLTDLKGGSSRGGAVNGKNPYYNYYNYLPFRTQSVYTAEELDSFIEANTVDKPTSKLKGIGKALKESEQKYGVNAILTLSVAINESGWGTSTIAQTKNNLFGIKAYDSDPTGNSQGFETPGDSVIGFTKHYISKGYCDSNDFRGYGSLLGNKEVGANVKYASDPFWGEKAAGLAFRIDYQLSNKSIENLRDFNNYQLVMITGENTIYNSKNEVLYSVGEEKITSKGILKKGVVVPLNALGTIDNSRGKEYMINPDRKDIVTNVDVTGEYDFSVNGFLSTNNTKLINKAKSNSTVYVKEDINGDGKVDIEDLGIISSLYNKTSSQSGWNSSYDLNNDNIIDLYDLIKVSKKI